MWTALLPFDRRTPGAPRPGALLRARRGPDARKVGYMGARASKQARQGLYEGLQGTNPVGLRVDGGSVRRATGGPVGARVGGKNADRGGGRAPSRIDLSGDLAGDLAGDLSFLHTQEASHDGGR